MNKPSLATAKKNSSLVLNGSAKIKRQRTIVVLGVERGGTSMAAGIVRALGISMGQRAGLNHEDPLFLTDEQDRLLNRIKMRNTQEDVWGFKVPKASMMLDFYENHLRNPLYVVVYRNPVAIIDSWLQRGAGSPVGVMERIVAYQNSILELMQKTKAPVLLLNYERAVQSDTTKQQTVESVASFIGVELNEELRDRAVGMMTGDGRGYVNLPEHFFAVSPLDGTPAPSAELAMIEAEDVRDSAGWIHHEKVPPRLIYTAKDSENLPKKFVLEMDFDHGGTMAVENTPLRIYFNFIGEYFPGHCTRPPVQIGKNRYLIETSGKASAIAFGPLDAKTRFKLAPRFYTVD